MESPNNSHIREYLAAFTGTLVMFSTGNTISWSSPSLPKLQAADSPVPTTEDEGSWMVSLMLVGLLLSPVITATLANKFGRKTTLLAAAIPFAVGWILVIVANSVAILYVSRLISGVGVGMAYATAPMYLGEIASDKVRGSIGIIMIVMANSGLLFGYCIGPYVSIFTFAAIALTVPIIFVALFIWFPESPYFLLTKNRPDDAMKSLQRLRGYENVKSELANMKLSVQNDHENSGAFKQLFQSRGSRKALAIGCGLGACQQLCGSLAISSYSEAIFDSAHGSVGGSESTIILGAAQLVASVVASSTVDMVGRRPLLLLSTSGTAITTAAVGTYFYLKDVVHTDVSNISWLPLAALILYFCTFSFGLDTVTFAVFGEIFHTDVKAIGTGCAIIIAAATGAVITKLYQVVADGVGSYVAFWMFTGFMILGTIFVYITVPETKGKSFVQIQAELNGEIYEDKA